MMDWTILDVVTFNDISSSLSYHDSWSIEVSTDDTGHDAGVHHPDVVQPHQPALTVHHGVVVPGVAHLAGAGGMVGAVTLPPHEVVQLGVRSEVRARLQLRTSELVKCWLGEYLPGEPHTLPHLVPANTSQCSDLTTGSLETEKLKWVGVW